MDGREIIFPEYRKFAGPKALSSWENSDTNKNRSRSVGIAFDLFQAAVIRSRRIQNARSESVSPIGLNRVGWYALASNMPGRSPLCANI